MAESAFIAYAHATSQPTAGMEQADKYAQVLRKRRDG